MSQNEILKFGRNLLLAKFGSERVNNIESAEGQFHTRQRNFEFFKIKFCTMKLNQQKAETMGCLKLLRSCASCPCA